MKKALVIHVINSSLNKKEKFSKLNSSIKKINGITLKDISSPDFSKATEDETKSIVDNLPSGTCICVTLFEKEKSKIIVCLPGFSSHINIPVKKGEIIWYFVDESFYGDQNDDKSKYIKNFWLSRVHGLNVSEDPTFSFHLRDFEKNLDENKRPDGIVPTKKAREKQSNKVKAKNIKNGIVIPDYNEDFIKSSNKNISFSSKKIISKESHLNYYPKYYDDNNSFLLQGSSNAFINLNTDIKSKSSKRGGIDIVAGRLSEINNIRSDIVDKKFNILDKNSVKTGKEHTFKVSEEFPVYYIKNELEEIETLKDPNNYLFEEDSLKIPSRIENEINFDLDSSRVYVCERDNIDAKFKLKNHIANQSDIDKEISIEKIKIGKFIDFENKNKKDKKIDVYNKSYPSILNKSNIIRIVAREKYENTEIDKSSIRIIKDSKDYNDYSHICLENNGNILIDGNKILIGNFKRSILNQNKISIEEFNDITNNKNKKSVSSIDIEKLDSMSGNGDTIILGHSELFSEPLVLGNSLVNVLKELININIKLIDELSKGLTKIDAHTHVISGPDTSTPMPVMLTFLENTKIKAEKTKIEDIKNNLNKLLSKVSKTS